MITINGIDFSSFVTRNTFYSKEDNILKLQVAAIRSDDDKEVLIDIIIPNIDKHINEAFRKAGITDG